MSIKWPSLGLDGSWSWVPFHANWDVYLQFHFRILEYVINLDYKILFYVLSKRPNEIVSCANFLCNSSQNKNAILRFWRNLQLRWWRNIPSQKGFLRKSFMRCDVYDMNFEQCLMFWHKKLRLARLKFKRIKWINFCLEAVTWDLKIKIAFYILRN